ncbi:MAG TPA: hypothetical protein VF317_02455 [Dermatophilaceae bacterium]
MCVRNSLRVLVGRVEGWRLTGWPTKGPPDDWSPCMSDLVFVILTGAFFALASLIVKGVERL